METTSHRPPSGSLPTRRRFLTTLAAGGASVGAPWIEPVEVGYRTASLCILGNMAQILKCKFRWDPVAQRSPDNEEVNRMLTRPMRAPWHLQENGKGERRHKESRRPEGTKARKGEREVTGKRVRFPISFAVSFFRAFVVVRSPGRSVHFFPSFPLPLHLRPLQSAGLLPMEDSR